MNDLTQKPRCTLCLSPPTGDRKGFRYSRAGGSMVCDACWQPAMGKKPRVVQADVPVCTRHV